MPTLPSIAVANGTTVSAEPTDPLVTRRDEVTREHLREAIRRLSAEERDALRLATRERRSVDEAADELGVDTAEVYYRLYAGLHSLRQSLIDGLGEG